MKLFNITSGKTIRRLAAIVLLALLPAAVSSQSAHAEGGGRQSNAAPAQVSQTSVSAVGGDISSASPPLRFAHLTTDDGLSENHIYSILQDRRGFMWFATREGLNRYDGNTFVVFKNNPSDPTTISANFVLDLFEDAQGFLWIGTYNGGVDRFDPVTERFTRYRHDPDNPNSLSGDMVRCIRQDSHGHLWFGGDTGLNKFDPATGTFTRYRNDSDGKSIGTINSIIEDSRGDVWFAGTDGLFHINPQTGQIAHAFGTDDSLKADYVCEDKAGNLWLLAWSPAVGLIKYDRQTWRLTQYPVGTGAVGMLSSQLLDDGQNGFWVSSSLGLYHFDRQTERFTHRFQHDETNPDSLNDNHVVSIYKDRSGLLWLGTENLGLNLLNFQQEQFGYYRHDPANPNSLSPGRVSAIYEDPDGILWVGYTPRALDRFDRKTGQVTHYVPDPEAGNTIGEGYDIKSIYKDTQGYLWLGGWGGRLVRFDERSGQFKHYRPNPDDPNSIISDAIFDIYQDRSDNLWVGQYGGISRFDPATERFTNYRPDPNDPTSLGSGSVRIIYQDRAGVLWLGTFEGVLSRFDAKTRTFVNYTPDSRDPHKLNGGCIYAIYEDQAGNLWLGATDGLYRFNRKNETFTRYTESQGLPSSNIQGILGDDAGRLWLSTKKGLSRFDPRTETFRNYNAADGLQSNDFSERCYAQGQNGEMFFGGSKGFNAFFPENIRDNPYVPPVVLTEFQLFNKPVAIGKDSPLKKAINVTDQITLRYDQEVFRLRFSALSFAQPQENHYAYKLEGFDNDWRYTDANDRSATYTKLPPGSYTFRVKVANNDGVWNEQGASIKITVLPPWWATWWFRAMAAASILGLVFAGYRLRVRSMKQRSLELESQVADRTAQLQAANKELESFSHSVSHDLRAPLRAIDGFSRILLEDYDDKLDDDGRDSLHRVCAASQRMGHLIDDMLQLSRLARTEMHSAPVDLSALANTVADELQKAEPARRVEFVVEPNLTAQADANLMRVVLENLIGNAWKFTGKQSAAKIEFGRTTHEGASTFYVRDDGVGFNMGYADKLFGAFQRLHTTAEFPGTGIGLATVQRIIHRHSGRVWAESAVGQGATFYFTLPNQQPENL